MFAKEPSTVFLLLKADVKLKYLAEPEICLLPYILKVLKMMLKPVSFIIEPNINSSFSKTACRSMKMRSGFFYDFLVLFVGASLCGTMLTSRS